MSKPWTRKEFEDRLREKGKGYHIYHPFHVMMYEGKLSKEQLQSWVLNRFYYQISIPLKDAAILSNCPDQAIRKEWIVRILDHDGEGEVEGGIEAWINLGKAVGLTREDVTSLEHVSPGVKFAVDAYLIVTPYYNKPTQEGLYQHYMAIADAVKKPVMLYNVPGRTAVDLLPATVARLAVHGNIFAIKEATGDVSRVAEIQQGCGKDFLQFSGDDATAREYMLLGGHGVISVTTNVAPKQMQAMCAAALAGDADKAAELDAPLSSLHRDLFVESNPIPVKWAVAKQGLCDGTLRLPLTELSAVNQPAVEAALAKASALEGNT